MTIGVLIFNYAKYLIATLIVPIFTAIFVMIIEKKPIKKMYKGILMFPIFMGSWLIINLKCIINAHY